MSRESKRVLLKTWLVASPLAAAVAVLANALAAARRVPEAAIWSPAILIPAFGRTLLVVGLVCGIMLLSIRASRRLGVRWALPFIGALVLVLMDERWQIAKSLFGELAPPPDTTPLVARLIVWLGVAGAVCFFQSRRESECQPYMRNRA
jgi:hypothetical protein